MAKNYTFAEAVAIINEGKDMEAITDIGRRYPILLNKVTKVAAIAGEAFVDLMGYMPEYLTANKVNTAMKNGVAESTGDDDSEDDGAEAPKAMETAVEGEDMPDYSAMSGKALWDILGKAGARKTAKSTKKPDLVAACEALWNKQHSGDADEADTDVEDDAAEETSENPYEGKSAMELFKECKKRGIKAAAKKPAKFYADLLIKADAKAENTEDAAEDDDWDADEAEEEAPAKPAKKAAAKPAKKAAKKAETEDDGEDDWDI